MDAIKQLFVLLLLMNPLITMGQQVEPSQIIDSSTIRASGYVRLSEVIQLINVGSKSTVNGDRWFINLNGGGNFDVQNFTLMVNGAKVNLDLAGQIPFNYLLIPVSDISRIEVVTEPGLYYGELNTNGIIHVITWNKPVGAFYNGFYSQGSESGDPGPFLYKNANNVDRIGLHFAHVFGYSSANFSLDYTFYYSDYYFRDSSLVNRVIKSDSFTGKSNLIGHRFNLNQKVKKFSQRFSLCFSDGYDYNFHPVENEILSDNRHLFAAYSASFDIKSDKKIFYNGSYLDFKTIPFRLPYLPIFPNQIWQSHQLGSRGSVNSNDSGLTYEVSAQFTAVNEWNNSKHFNYEIYNARLGLKWRLGQFDEFNSVFGLTKIGSERAPAIGFQYFNRHVKNFPWRMSFSHEQQLSASMSSVLLNAYVSGYAVNPNHKVKQSMFQAELQIKGIPGCHIKLISNLRLQSNMASFNWVDIQPNASNSSMIYFDDFYFFSPQIEVEYLPFSRLKTRVAIHHQQVIKGDKSFMAEMPANWLNLEAALSLPDRFTFWYRFYAQSSYFEKSIFVSELTISKKALMDALNLSFSIRNVTNAYEKYHPSGAQFDLRLFISLRFSLNAKFSKDK